MVWGLLVWIAGIPYERDCYLIVTLKSQTTKPNHQFPISWSSQHPQQVVVFPLAKNPTFGKCRVTPWWPFFGKLNYNVTIDSIKQQWVYFFHVYEGTPPKKNFTICTVTTLLQCFGRIQKLSTFFLWQPHPRPHHHRGNLWSPWPLWPLSRPPSPQWPPPA